MSCFVIVGCIGEVAERDLRHLAVEDTVCIVNGEV